MAMLRRLTFCHCPGVRQTKLLALRLLIHSYESKSIVPRLTVRLASRYCLQASFTVRRAQIPRQSVNCPQSFPASLFQIPRSGKEIDINGIHCPRNGCRSSRGSDGTRRVVVRYRDEKLRAEEAKSRQLGSSLLCVFPSRKVE